MSNDSKNHVGRVELPERKKQYQLMFRPSIREKLSRLAKTSGARSASDYLDKLIEEIEE